MQLHVWVLTETQNRVPSAFVGCACGFNVEFFARQSLGLVMAHHRMNVPIAVFVLCAACFIMKSTATNVNSLSMTDVRVVQPFAIGVR